MSKTEVPRRILVVDDEPDLRALYELTLLRAGYQVQVAENLEQARTLLQEQRFELMITDMRLPDGLGMELIKDLKHQARSERSIVITAYDSAQNAVEALKAGAFDYLSKPVDLQQFRAVVASALDSGESGQQAAALATEASADPGSQAGGTDGQRALSRLIGQSTCMQQIKAHILKIAPSMAPVLVTGESGTGKELVSYAIHANSHRARGPWVAVNCSAIPETLLEAEFFGAKKGAYTGATQNRDGFFQAARGGTLFLDEIGDLPLLMQSKLLRAIQERRIRPLGSSQEEPVDVRIVSATHKNLAQEVQKGTFRQDLFFRLNVIGITIAPLRQRAQDLPELCQVLLQRIAQESGLPQPKLSPALLQQLVQLPLLGNVRELENLLYRAVTLGDGQTLQLDHAPVDSAALAPSPPEPTHFAAPIVAQGQAADAVPTDGDLQTQLDTLERKLLLQALQATQFNRTAAAARLGLSLRQIRYRMIRLKIDAPRDGDEAEDDR